MLDIKNNDKKDGHFVLNTKTGEMMIFSNVFATVDNSQKIQISNQKDYFSHGKLSKTGYVGIKTALQHILCKYKGNTCDPIINHEIIKLYLTHPDIWFLATDDKNEAGVEYIFGTKEIELEKDDVPRKSNRIIEKNQKKSGIVYYLLYFSN
jgi:hypothetical protein